MPSRSDRLHRDYASTHAGIVDASATRVIYRRDIRPRLPQPPAGERVPDIGCGQGALVALLRADVARDL